MTTEKHRERNIWSSMKDRCNNQNHQDFHNYGGRGIRVCPEWNSYEQFLKDMGRRPSSCHMLERRDNNLGYSASNCYWATRSAQNRNNRRNTNLSLFGLTACVEDWCLLFGINRTTFDYRIKNIGLEAEDALLTPVKRKYRKDSEL